MRSLGGGPERAASSGQLGVLRQMNRRLQERFDKFSAATKAQALLPALRAGGAMCFGLQTRPASPRTPLA